MPASSPPRRLPRLAAVCLILCAMFIPVLSWSAYASSVLGVTASIPQKSYSPAADPAEDYRALSRQLSRRWFSQDQIHSLWNRMGADLLELLETGVLSYSDLSYLAFPFSREELLARYQALAQSAPGLSVEETVLQVNMGLDRPFYQDAEILAAPAGVDVLVNKYHVLPEDYVPELVPLTGLGSGSLAPPAAEAFRQMAQAAQADGITLRSVSAYRSYQTQRSLYQSYVNQWGQANADTYSARAGSSEHQTGLALDINVSTRWAYFEKTPAYAWLAEHCAEYGFILRYPEGKQHITGYRFEPWHYRYVGTEAAKACMDHGLTYEEYIALLPAEEDSRLPHLIVQGTPLELEESPLMLEGALYVPAASLAQSLGWNASFSGRKAVLFDWDRQISLAPWLRCQADGVTLEQTAPVLPLDEALYLPLDDLCAALGAALERTPGGDYLITPA